MARQLKNDLTGTKSIVYIPGSNNPEKNEKALTKYILEFMEVNMANLIIICAPQAVGKMTVTENLRDKLKYNMMMNHDSIEISDKIFGLELRRKKSLMPQERAYLSEVAELFTDNGGEFYFVELSASLEARLERNETPHRMERKASKKDTAWSKSNLLRDAERHRLNSNDGEVWFKNRIKIDNTSLRPNEVANMIIKEFKLVANKKEEKEYRFDV